VPGAIPPTSKLIDWLFVTLTVPLCATVEAPPGPVIVQLTVLTWSPPGSVSCIPTVPVTDVLGGRVPSLGVEVPGEVVSRAPSPDEQPTSETDTAVTEAAPTSSAL
jgi:hypothetical protein